MAEVGTPYDRIVDTVVYTQPALAQASTAFASWLEVVTQDLGNGRTRVLLRPKAADAGSDLPLAFWNYLLGAAARERP